MPSPSEGLIPLMSLRNRCATSFLSCDPFTGNESHFSRDAYGTDTIEPFRLGLDPTTPAEVDDSSTVEKEPEPRLLMTPTSANGQTAPLTNGTLDGTPIRTARTLSKRFERPNYLHIFAHVAFCCIAYPIIYVGAVAAKDKSLFGARVIVGLWCAGIGVVIGWSLVTFATKYTEAASKHTSPFFEPCRVPDLVLIGFLKHGPL